MPDPRCNRKKRHVLAQMLVCVVLGFLVGRTSLRRSLTWCREHLDMLQKYMPLENGIASISTVSRMLGNIDAELFALTFMEWIGEILSTKGIHIVIDGKALRAATEKIKDGKTPYILNAIDAATGLVVAQMAISDKDNEKTAIPELLKVLDFEGSIITVDAIGTTANIMNCIIERGGHFLLTVKKNNPATYDQIMNYFNHITQEQKKHAENSAYKPILPEDADKYDEWKSSEKNRERYEHRTYKIYNDASVLTRQEKELPYLKSIGIVSQVRIPVEKDREGNDITPTLEEFLKNGSRKRKHPASGDAMTDDIQIVGMISDVTMTAEEMGKLKRNQWAIENSLHYVLDQAFDEDHSTARKSKNNLALLRKFAYNIVRLAILREYPKKSVRGMLDKFADNSVLLIRYVFCGIESFY